MLKTNLLWLFTLCIIQSTLSQTWDLHSIKELDDLGTNYIYDIEPADSGFYLCGYGGIYFCDYEHQYFSRNLGFSYPATNKAQYSNGELFVLSATNSVFRIESNNNHTILLPPTGTSAEFVDISANNGTLAIASRINGLYLYQNQSFTQYTSDNSDLINNSIKNISWYGNSLVISGYFGAQFFKNQEFEAVNGLSGTQIIKQCSDENKCFFLHENGLEVYANEVVKKIDLDSFEISNILDLKLSEGVLYLFTKNQVFQLLSNGTWMLLEQSLFSNTTSTDILTHGDLTIISTVDKGITVNYNGYIVDYGYGRRNFAIADIALTTNELYGVTSSGNLFKLDTVINRLRLMGINTGESSKNLKLLVNARNELFQYNFYSVTDLQNFTKANLIDDYLWRYRNYPFIEPNNQLPAMYAEGRFYSINGYSAQRHFPVFSSEGNRMRWLDWNNGGDVYFLYDHHVEVWSASEDSADALHFNSVYDIGLPGYDLIHCLGKDSFLLQGPEETVFVCPTAPKKLSSDDPGFFTESTMVVNFDNNHFAQRTPGENYLNIYSKNNLNITQRLAIPSEVSGSKAAKSNNSSIAILNDTYIGILNKSTIELTSESNDEVIVYPNPSNSKLFIAHRLPNSKEAVVSIFDINGQMLEQETKVSQGKYDVFEIDISTKISGVYIVKMEFDTQSEIFKIIKI